MLKRAGRKKWNLSLLEQSKFLLGFSIRFQPLLTQRCLCWAVINAHIDTIVQYIICSGCGNNRSLPIFFAIINKAMTCRHVLQVKRAERCCLLDFTFNWTWRVVFYASCTFAELEQCLYLSALFRPKGLTTKKPRASHWYTFPFFADSILGICGSLASPASG